MIIFYYAECQYAECHYAECLYAKCHYAECRGTVMLTFGIIHPQTINDHKKFVSYVVNSNPKCFFLVSFQIN
jgi:hypothetical protein